MEGSGGLTSRMAHHYRCMVFNDFIPTIEEKVHAKQDLA